MASQHEIIVAGAGVAGLTAAAYLAAAGRDVLVLDKNRRVGGYAATFKKNGHHFDIATQALGGLGPDGEIMNILDDLGIADRVQALPCEPARVYHFPGMDAPYVQHGSWKKQRDELAARFPDHADAVAAAFDTLRAIFEELLALSNDSSHARFSFVRRCPTLAARHDQTLQAFMDELGFPPELARLFAARAGYQLLAADEISLVGFACNEMTFGNGAYMIRGGVARLVDALVRCIESSGGTILRGRGVREVQAAGDSFTVRTDYKTHYADALVWAASIAQLERACHGSSMLPETYWNRISSLRMSGSYYILYCSAPANVVDELHRRGAVFPNMEYVDSDGRPWYLLIPSLVDREMARADSHCVCLSVPLAPGRRPDRTNCRELHSRLLDALASAVPELAGQLDPLFSLTPSSLEAMTGNPGGSAYGWTQIPAQSGFRRLSTTTPKRGLFLAGHWSMPGGGLAAAMISGRLCVHTILKDSRP